MTLATQANLPEYAQKILPTQVMKRGDPNCIAGSGIYFAETPEETAHKAHNHGVMLSCQVLLGNCVEISAQGDKSITFASLLQSVAPQ